MISAETIAGDSLLAGLEDDWESALKYLSTFIDEAQHTLDEMIEALLALEAGRGGENVERLLAATHRLKGSAASSDSAAPPNWPIWPRTCCRTWWRAARR